MKSGLWQRMDLETPEGDKNLRYSALHQWQCDWAPFVCILPRASSEIFVLCTTPVWLSTQRDHKANILTMLAVDMLLTGSVQVVWLRNEFNMLIQTAETSHMYILGTTAAHETTSWDRKAILVLFFQPYLHKVLNYYRLTIEQSQLRMSTRKVFIYLYHPL